jgi:uncharacterized protein YgiM (DUF1202 family)
MHTNDNVTRSALLTPGNIVSRRSLLKSAAGLGLAAVAATALGSGIAQAGLAQYRTTTALNLRTGAGTLLAHMGKVANNFYEVGYGHTYGWVHSAYLTPAGTTDPVILGTTRTVATVNLRSGPSIHDGVLRVLASGTSVQFSDTVRNGFRYVIHNGLAGWIHDSFLAQRDAPSETFTTTARLNLRATPSATAAVLLVMPANSVVTAMSGTANGWRQVSYKGTVGWAATPYLN